MWSAIRNSPIRHLLAAGLLLFVLAGLLFAMDPNRERAAKEAAAGQEGVRVRSDLDELSALAVRAQRRAKTTVFRMTGRGCSDCFCRAGDLRKSAETTRCMAAWLNVLTRLDAAAGSTGAPAKYARDPWGSPYGIDENQGEGGAAACRTADRLRSVGPDGIYGTADDIIVSIPLADDCP